MPVQFFPLKTQPKDIKQNPNVRPRPAKDDHSDTAMLNAAIRRAKYSPTNTM